MKDYKFKSVFKNELYNFIEFKKSLGYNYISNIIHCKKIDDYWNNLKTNKIELIEKDVMQYSQRKNNESLSYHSSRLYVLKHFVNGKIKCRKSVNLNVGFPTFLINGTIAIEVIV